MSPPVLRARQLVDRLQQLEGLGRMRSLTEAESRELQTLEQRRQRAIYARQASIARAGKALAILSNVGSQT